LIVSFRNLKICFSDQQHFI